MEKKNWKRWKKLASTPLFLGAQYPNHLKTHSLCWTYEIRNIRTICRICRICRISKICQICKIMWIDVKHLMSSHQYCPKERRPVWRWKRKGTRTYGRILYFTYSAYFKYSAYFAEYNLKLFFTECLDTCQSTIVFERRESEQVLYVVPVSSILGRLPLVPVGSTGTIPFEMRRESADFPGAACDKSKDAGVVLCQELGPFMGNEAIVQQVNK